MVLVDGFHETRRPARRALPRARAARRRACASEVERFGPTWCCSRAPPCGDDPFERADEGTRFAQPAIYCAALAGWERLRDALQPDVMAGHSLGEVAALVAAGALSAEDGLRLVAAARPPDGGGRRARRRRRHAGRAHGATAPSSPRVAADAGLTVANDNAPSRSCCPGPTTSLDRVERVFRARGVRGRRLPVTRRVPLARMEAARSRSFRELLAGMEFREPAMPVCSSVTASAFDDVRAQPRRRRSSSRCAGATCCARCTRAA